MNRRVPPAPDHALSAVALGQAYRDGEMTPLDGIRACLSRLDEHGEALGAVTDRFDSEAIAAAERLTRELQAGRDRGPLHGIAIVVKELIDVAGCRRSAGSHVRPPGWEMPAPEDAPIVAALREAGAVLVARGRTHEFAWGITSRHPDGTGVVNPYDDRLIAGGSSGGVAALIAAGVAPIGVGTDTGGSVRIPAAFCGLVGWKPAFGALPIEGVVPLAPSLDHVGLLARSIDDAALADSVLGGGLARPIADDVPSRARSDGSDGLLRVARLRDPSLLEPDPDIVERIDAACARASIGLDVTAGTGGDEVPMATEMQAVYGVVQRAEAIAVHRALGTWPAQADRYGTDVAGRLREAEALTDEAVQDARDTRQQLRRRYQRAMAEQGVDAVVLPVSAGPPPSVDQPDRAMVRGVDVATRDAVMPFTIPADLLGWPTLSVPLTAWPPSAIGNRPPPSLQVMARPGTEDRIAHLAHRLWKRGAIDRRD